VQTKTPCNFHLINQNRIIQSFLYIYINIENQFQISISKKKDFFICPNYLACKKTTNHTITFEPCSQKLWKLLHHKDIPHPLVVLKFQRKRVKTPFIVSYPKILCCQKTQLGLLGGPRVKIQEKLTRQNSLEHQNWG